MGAREIPKQAIDLIKLVEGCRLEKYRDSVGLWTIGVGHLICPQNSVEFDLGLSMDEVDELLKRDLSTAAKAIQRLITVHLNDNQYSALLSFVFNLGAGALQRSTLRSKLNRGDMSVDKEFLKYCYAGGKKLRGLYNRRVLEVQLFNAPVTDRYSAENIMEATEVW